MRIELNHWVCIVHQHDCSKRKQGKARFLADGSVVHKPVLCVELFGAREGKGVHPHFFPQANRDFDGGRFVCGVMCSGADVEAKGSKVGSGCKSNFHSMRLGRSAFTALQVSSGKL